MNGRSVHRAQGVAASPRGCSILEQEITPIAQTAISGYSGTQAPAKTTVNLEDCLPAELRGPATTIVRVAAGLSGAGVHRVDANGRVFVLKVAGDGTSTDEWRRKVTVQRLAADAGLAPRIVHTDETRRAVVSEFVADDGFLARLGDPRTRAGAIVQIGQTVRRVHALPIPAGVEESSARDLFRRIWSGLEGSSFVPTFVRQAMERVLAEQPPASDRGLVLSHNDVNPTNLVHDGERLLFVDWDTAGANDPYYDLATASVFLRMDAAHRRTLLSAYEGEAVERIPPRFDYNRRLMATLFAVSCLAAARQGGHPGATGDETMETTMPLGDFYQRLRSGLVNIATVDGQWSFGLSMVREVFGEGEAASAA